MRLTVNGLSALRALRVFRRAGGTVGAERCPAQPADPSPQRRWTTRCLPLDRLGLDGPPTPEHPLEVLVPSGAPRVQASFARCSTRSGTLPEGSFVDLGDGLFAPGPELLFLELAEVMSPAALSLLGMELCGTYVRDPADPRLGDVTYDVPPATSVARISAYLDACGNHRRWVLLARHALAHVADNAWSNMEAIVAYLAHLGPYDLGYGLGAVELNVRHGASPELVALGARTSRVPDIQVVGTHVGFNYDGRDHLDLESIARAAAEGDAAPTIEQVRERYHDDLRRNRELAAQGCVALTVTARDLFSPGGVDAIMLEAAMAISELDGGYTLSDVSVAILSSPKSRQELIWSLLPWPQGIEHAHNAARRKPWFRE